MVVNLCQLPAIVRISLGPATRSARSLAHSYIRADHKSETPFFRPVMPHLPNDLHNFVFFLSIFVAAVRLLTNYLSSRRESYVPIATHAHFLWLFFFCALRILDWVVLDMFVRPLRPTEVN